MRKTILVMLIALLLLVSNNTCPTQAQTLEQVKRKQIEQTLKSPNGQKIKTSVRKYAKQYKLEETLILALIMTESGFNPRAVSSHGCSGLMQLNPRTFKARKVGNNIFDIDTNIHAGTKHLRGLYDRYKGNKYYMLAAYNYGGSSIMLNKPLPNGAKKYVNKVYYHKKIIEEIQL